MESGNIKALLNGYKGKSDKIAVKVVGSFKKTIPLCCPHIEKVHLSVLVQKTPFSLILKRHKL